jgi:DNA polymerase-3 subunit gamma/tau
MRDAFTLFDQVAAFSGGNIRSELIREKLGIIGLEKLNAFAQACAANDAPAAFALTDELLSSGVAIEQFVIDLAGYYRGLLLLKNGVTRESLLGYKSSQFSAKVLDTYDSIRIEQALELLLDCYRDIRYSVSPRFELETAVSKLSWLTRWASPVELKDALENARSVLGGGQVAAQPKPVSRAAEPPKPAAAAKQPVDTRHPLAGGSSLTDVFNRMVAEKETGVVNNEEDDVPVWSNVVHNDETDTVKRVLDLIPGTVVSEGA